MEEYYIRSEFRQREEVGGNLLRVNEIRNKDWYGVRENPPSYEQLERKTEEIPH
jgi:hypothetical protein